MNPVEAVAQAIDFHQHDGWVVDGGEPQRCCVCSWTGINHGEHVASAVLARLNEIGALK